MGNTKITHVSTTRRAYFPKVQDNILCPEYKNKCMYMKKILYLDFALSKQSLEKCRRRPMEALSTNHVLRVFKR